MRLFSSPDCPLKWDLSTKDLVPCCKSIRTVPWYDSSPYIHNTSLLEPVRSHCDRQHSVGDGIMIESHCARASIPVQCLDVTRVRTSFVEHSIA
jgi:hypothetical protein